MANSYRNSASAQNNYDPRWFIWTIVFLVVVGISLTSYIMLSDHGTYDSSEITRHITKNQ